jgi:hypothetical protein
MVRLLVCCIFILSCSIVYAQRDIEKDKIKIIPKPKVVSPRSPRPRDTTARDTTGSVIIGPVDDDATILVNGKRPRDLNVKVTLKKEEKQVELDDVPEGFYTLSISSPRIATWNRDNVRVQGGATSYITTTFVPAVVTLIVRSEPDAEIYLDGMMAGKTSASGELRIPDKKPGQHTIRVEKDSFEPVEKTETFGIGSAVVELRLSRIKSSPEFSDYFQAGSSFWDAPNTWQMKSGKLHVRNSAEVGLRTGIYDNFKMIFDISFTNDKGAAWIVRARDKRNYYLFQLGGTKAASPKFFQSYVYQNGQPKLLTSARVVEDLSRPNDSYTITIEAKGPTIKHFIKLKSNPAGGSELFGTLTDNTFSYGAIGFGTVGGEEFVVYSVTVLPDETKPR